LLGGGHAGVPGYAGECQEQAEEDWVGGPQFALYRLEDPLLAGWQAHCSVSVPVVRLAADPLPAERLTLDGKTRALNGALSRVGFRLALDSAWRDVPAVSMGPDTGPAVTADKRGIVRAAGRPVRRGVAGHVARRVFWATPVAVRGGRARGPCLGRVALCGGVDGGGVAG